MTSYRKFDKIVSNGDVMKIKLNPPLVIKILLIALTVCWLGFIFSNSIQTAEASSNTSGRVVGLLNCILRQFNIPFVFTQNIVRTLAHFCEFAILGVLGELTALSCANINIKSLPLVTAVCAFSALADEIIQLFSDGRAFQVSDILVDSLGAIAGCLFTYLLIYLICRIKASRINQSVL